MDNFFRPTNPIFVGFCALLVVAIFAAGYIRDQRILEQAKVIGRQEAEWSWPSQGISTNIVDDIQARILKRTENDAEVEVKGKQNIVLQAPGAVNPTNDPTNIPTNIPANVQASVQTNTQALAGSESNSKSGSSSDFKAILTLYKNGNSRIWVLGKVEGQ
jgi:hypothetical protein